VNALIAGSVQVPKVGQDVAAGFYATKLELLSGLGVEQNDWPRDGDGAASRDGPPTPGFYIG
jgi:hypothetical protein